MAARSGERYLVCRGMRALGEDERRNAILLLGALSDATRQGRPDPDLAALLAFAQRSLGQDRLRAFDSALLRVDVSILRQQVLRLRC